MPLPQVATSDKVIIERIERELAELRPFRQTRRGGNLIYRFKAVEAPTVFKEIARLREVTYRANGGGTGKAEDVDAFDLRENAYRQIIVWNEEQREIIGGFRYGLGKEGDFATEGLYTFSPRYLKDFHPHTMDLGRMFIQPAYQVGGENNKGLFSLDNIWDGLGAVLSEEPEIRFILGRVVSFRGEESVEQMIADFFARSFPLAAGESQPLLSPKTPHCDKVVHPELFVEGDSRQNYKTLLKLAKQKGTSLTPLIFAYMNVAKTLQYMGTALDEELGVLESCILVRVDDIYLQFKKRHYL